MKTPKDQKKRRGDTCVNIDGVIVIYEGPQGHTCTLPAGAHLCRDLLVASVELVFADGCIFSPIRHELRLFSVLSHLNPNFQMVSFCFSLSCLSKIFAIWKTTFPAPQASASRQTTLVMTK